MKKLFLLLLVIPLLMGTGCMNNQKKLESDKLELNEKKDFDTPVSQAEDSQSIYENKLKNQLTFFEDVFEIASKAAAECTILVNYNWVADSGRLSEAGIGFNKPKETYKQNCTINYLKATQNKKNLVAEPELVDLRKKISELLNVIEELAIYANDGGSNPTAIDSYDKKLNILTTEIQEEIIKVKRYLSIE